MATGYLTKITTELCKGFTPQPPERKESPCISLPPKIVKDPDPAIYDPYLEFRAGRPFSFDSPDITTIKLWPIRPSETIGVTVRNLSGDASATNTRINVSWSPWGIGMERKPLGSTTVNLSRAGYGASEATVLLTTPAEVIAANRYGVFVELVHPFDRDLSNNQGEQTVDGFSTNQTREGSFVIPVRNPKNSSANIDIKVHPEKWGAKVTPSSMTLAPGAQQNIVFSVKVPVGIPPSPVGTLVTDRFEIHATVQGQLLGGVAIIVLIDS